MTKADKIYYAIRSGNFITLSKIEDLKNKITVDMLLYALETGSLMIFQYISPIRLDDEKLYLLYNRSIELGYKNFIEYFKLRLPCNQAQHLL